MKRKEQYADEIIEMLERTKCGAWASNINLNTKDRVIEVCQNVVDDWSGRKFKDHCTTLPQALEQEPRWIPIGERLPKEAESVLVYAERNAYDDKGKFRKKVIDIGWQVDGRWHIDGCSGVDGIAWMPLPQPYKAESEDEE